MPNQPHGQLKSRPNSFMTKEELILKIYELIQHPLVPTAESVRISAVLDKMSEEDLKTLHTNLIGRTQALLDTERIFAEVENQAVRNFDPIGVMKDRINQHPLVDLPLAIAAESLRDHVMEYLAKGIDLRQETELYFQILRDVAIRDGEEIVSKVETYPEVLKVFLEALRNSKVLLDQSSDKKQFDVKEVIKEYDSTYPYSSINRGSYERASFVDKLNFKKENQGIVRNLLDYYDFLINESHFELVGSDSLKEFEELNSTADDEEDTAIEPVQYESKITEVIPNNKVISDPYRKTDISKSIGNKKVYSTEDLNKNKKILESKNFEVAAAGQNQELKEGFLPISMITPTTQTIKSIKPALIFNIEDEKEVDKHREKAGTPPVLEHVLRAFVDEIIATKNLVFRDEVNQRRFIQLMVSRLKDVRGPLEIAEVLRKPAEAGGLGMTEEKADQVQGIMEEAKREFEIRVKNQSLKIPEPIAERPAQPAPVKVEPAKPSYDAAAAKAWRDQMLREIQAQGQPATIVEGSQPAVPKPQLADVKAPPKVVGPLDELRGLNLVDFRRLGSTAQEALQKVKGKIDLLGEMSVTRRVEAVRAWKSSLVYQQYLQLGRESIEQGKPISLVVSNHQTLGDQVLTEDEFTAIADFNAKLRF